MRARMPPAVLEDMPADDMFAAGRKKPGTKAGLESLGEDAC